MLARPCPVVVHNRTYITPNHRVRNKTTHGCFHACTESKSTPVSLSLPDRTRLATGMRQAAGEQAGSQSIMQCAHSSRREKEREPVSVGSG